MAGRNGIPDYLKNFSHKMRRNMTKEERHLWFDFSEDILYG